MYASQTGVGPEERLGGEAIEYDQRVHAGVGADPRTNRSSNSFPWREADLVARSRTVETSGRGHRYSSTHIAIS